MVSIQKRKEKKKNKRKKHTFADHTWVLWPLGFLNTGGGAESASALHGWRNICHPRENWTQLRALQRRKPHFELPGMEAGHSLVSSSQLSNSWSLAFWVKSLLPQMHFPSGGDRISLSGRHFSKWGGGSETATEGGHLCPKPQAETGAFLLTLLWPRCSLIDGVWREPASSCKL